MSDEWKKRAAAIKQQEEVANSAREQEKRRKYAKKGSVHIVLAMFGQLIGINVTKTLMMDILYMNILQIYLDVKYATSGCVIFISVMGFARNALQHQRPSVHLKIIGMFRQAKTR